MTHDALKSRVRDILNEHGGEDVLSISTDHVLLDEYIERCIPDAVVVLSNAGYRVNPKSITVGTMEDGFILIPDDFISLLALRIQGWKRTVTEISGVDSNEYRWAMNGFTQPGVNGPMCYREGNKLFFLPVADDDIDFGEYNAVYDSEDGLKGDEQAATAVAYMAASLVMALFENDNAKKRLLDIAMEMVK